MTPKSQLVEDLQALMAKDYAGQWDDCGHFLRIHGPTILALQPDNAMLAEAVVDLDGSIRMGWMQNEARIKHHAAIALAAQYVE